MDQAESAGRPRPELIRSESSFDIRMLPAIKVPEDYGRHFLSFDGKERNFIVESAGGDHVCPPFASRTRNPRA